MSDCDDWENQLDSDFEEKEKQKKEAEELAKKKAFEDEDNVNQEELAKKKKEEAKKLEEEQQKNARVKKNNKIDYDKAFEERQAKLAGVSKTAQKPTDEDVKGMSQQAKGIILEQAAEKGLADQLFGDLEGETVLSTKKLNTEKEYKEFGANVAKILYAGSAPYRIENFYREVSANIADHCDSKQIQKIIDQLQIIQKQKFKQEKEERDGKTKKSKPVALKGVGKAYDRNNNPGMIADVIGDVYGEEDDYGEEGEKFQRENEANYDFM